ncbi:MAG TPA: SH3 domain-containing protein [Clostridia bacterium]|nr:SH3 domain-containing protein [Clostridia bacterium]
MKKILYLLFIITLITVGCSPGAVNDEGAENGDEISEPVENNNLGNATIIGINISLRESPDTSSERIDLLSFPSEVYLIEKSESKEKIGDHEEYWYKVRSGDSTGWCYGAFIASEDELQQALSDRINDLLPVDKSTPVSKSVSTLKSIISMTENVDLADKGVIRIKTLQENLMPALEAEMLPLTETLYGYTVEDLRQPENLPDGSIQDLMKKYRDMGYSVYMAEGMYYLDPSPRFLLGNFKTNISDDLFDYLTYRADEVENHTYSDAAVMISWDELGKRMNDWEKFMDKYPDSDYFSEAESMYNMYRFTFLVGASNTPAYEYPTEILDPDLLEAYKNYVSRFPKSSMTPVIEDLMVLLEEESYKKTEKIMEFINPYNVW